MGCPSDSAHRFTTPPVAGYAVDAASRHVRARGIHLSSPVCLPIESRFSPPLSWVIQLSGYLGYFGVSTFLGI